MPTPIRLRLDQIQIRHVQATLDLKIFTIRQVSKTNLYKLAKLTSRCHEETDKPKSSHLVLHVRYPNSNLLSYCHPLKVARGHNHPFKLSSSLLIRVSIPTMRRTRTRSMIFLAKFFRTTNEAISNLETKVAED